jgi:hypothetical protein
MNSAPSWKEDLARDLDSILFRSAPRPSNQNLADASHVHVEQP